MRVVDAFALSFGLSAQSIGWGATSIFTYGRKGFSAQCRFG